MLIRRLVVFMFLIGALILGTGPAFSQDYPNKPIRVITAEAGSGNDVQLRIIAQALSVNLKQQVIVDNRGGGVVAGEVVSKAPPDGYTLLFYANSLWFMPLMRNYVPYDPAKDFTPISLVTNSPNVLVVHPKVAANSVKELIALAKTMPGKLNYGSAATGSSNHLAAEMFKALTGTDIMRVSFKGPASALTAVVTGEVQLMFPTPINAMSYVASGKLKALAVTSAKPSALTPGLPTLTASVPGCISSSVTALLAPAKTPAPIIKRLNQEVVRVLNMPDVKGRLFKLGVEGVGNSPEEAAEAIKSEIVTMGKVIKDANIRDE